MKKFNIIITTLSFLLITIIPDLNAFETGDYFVKRGWNFSYRLMKRYRQMGNNEHITYPACIHSDKMQVSDAQAKKILAGLSKTVTYICESMYGHHGFKVRSVTFTLKSNNQGYQEYGDPYPLNVRPGYWWSMGFANNFLSVMGDWSQSSDPGPNESLYHEFGHHFVQYHLDLNDSDIHEGGYFTRSVMDTPGGDNPTQYNMWGGDDLAGAIHMYRFSENMNNTPKCPKYYDLKTTGVTGESFPHNEPYPNDAWRCDPNLKNMLGFQIKNKGSGKCLKGQGSNNGTNITTAYCNSNDNSQKWDFLADDDGSYRIKNVANGKCFQIKGNSVSDGVAIEQYSCNSASSENAIQKFYPYDAGNNLNSLRSELSGRFIQASGDGIIQNKPNGAHNQRWIFTKTADDPNAGNDEGPSGYTWCAKEGDSFTLPGNCDIAYGANGKYKYLYNKTGTIAFNNNTFGDPTPGVFKAGYYKLTEQGSTSTSGHYKISAKHSGHFLDVSGVSKSNGALLHQWDWWNGDNQKWHLQSLGNGYYTIKAKHSGLCMDVTGGNTSGSNIVQWACHDGENQMFKLVDVGDGYYNIVAKHSGQCLDVFNGSRDKGANFIQWPCHGRDNQKFRVTPLQGLSYKYYHGVWTSLPNFDSLTPVKSGEVANFDLSVRNRNDNFAFKFFGEINIPTSGTYTFYTASDDGSKLYIDGKLVVNNDGIHAIYEKSGRLNLTAGTHDIKVTFFELGGGEHLSVKWEGPGISKQLIPGNVLLTSSESSSKSGSDDGVLSLLGCNNSDSKDTSSASVSIIFLMLVLIVDKKIIRRRK